MLKHEHVWVEKVINWELCRQSTFCYAKQQYTMRPGERYPFS